MSFQLPSYLEGDADLVPLRDPDAPESYDEETFTRAALALNRRLSIRSNRAELVQKHILRDDDTLQPGAISNRGLLSRRLSNRPTILDLKLRNILRNNMTNPLLEKSIDFEGRKKDLKGCLKKRLGQSDLITSNILSMDELADPEASNAKSLSQANTSLAMTKSQSLSPDKKTNFNHTVEVYSTFKKQEYNRKPDENATFRKLTPQMKVAIREELNTFKKTEMEVHEESAHNTCFH